MARTAEGALCVRAAPGQAAYSGVRFTGRSGYLSAADLAAISTAVRGCAVAGTPADLGARLVNAAYEARPAPLAFARPLGVEGGEMVVELVEVRYGEVTVAGGKTTRADYIRWRAGARVGALADVAALQGRLAGVPEVEDIRINADLQPGRVVGTSDLTLTVEEPEKPYALVASVDNYGAPSQGRWQGTVSGRWHSLTGRRDALSLSVTAARNKRAMSLGYDLPVTAAGTRLGVVLSYDRGSVARGLPVLLGLTTRTVTMGISLKHPLRADEAKVDILTFALSRTSDRADLVGPLLNQRIDEMRLGFSHVRRWPGRAVLSVAHAVSIGRVNDRIVGATDTYRAWSGFASLVYKLGDTLTASFDLGWQATSDVMPSSRRFGVTGPSALRGFDTNVGSANSGYYLRSQLNVTPRAAPAWGTVTPYGFVDMGEGFERIGGATVRQGMLASAGVGIGVAFRNGAGLDAWIAKPIRTNAAAPSRAPQAGVFMTWTF